MFRTTISASSSHLSHELSTPSSRSVQPDTKIRCSNFTLIDIEIIILQNYGDDEMRSVVVDKQSVYLSDVTISTICIRQQHSTNIIHPSSLREDYDFALEEKILGI